MTPPPTSDPPTRTGLDRWVSRWLFGQDPVQSMRLRQSGLALLLMALSVLLMQYAVDRGGALADYVHVWAAVALGGMAVIYLLIRSGWARRLKDPSMTVPQMLFAVAMGTVGYALLGPLRGMALPALVLIMMFGMFRLGARAALWMSVYALVLLGAAMYWMTRREPQVYAAHIELGHFLIMACVLPAGSLLAGRISHIRAQQQAHKLELSRALEQIRAMATRDSLTGLLNRRHMQTLLEQEVQRCQRGGHGYCIALIDLDNFKQINDRYGHAAGDAVLREFAQAAQQSIRGADVLARWGGEEFVLLLADTRMPAARAGVERLRARIEGVNVVVQHGVAIGFTFSAGLTESSPGEALMHTLDRADRLLYRAKAEGRNRVSWQ
ncbi:MAG: GGDEF domain-containing protein [Pelomonas sp.]|nr:GGDEF domain-containing protein [Roseateles sp.]